MTVVFWWNFRLLTHSLTKYSLDDPMCCTITIIRHSISPSWHHPYIWHIETVLIYLPWLPNWPCSNGRPSQGPQSQWFATVRFEYGLRLWLGLGFMVRVRIRLSQLGLWLVLVISNDSFTHLLRPSLATADPNWSCRAVGIVLVLVCCSRYSSVRCVFDSLRHCRKWTANITECCIAQPSIDVEAVSRCVNVIVFMLAHADIVRRP